MIRLHHTALFRGYVSRKAPEGIKEPYNGRYGKGYTVRKPNWNSTQYSIVEYWIEEKEEEEVMKEYRVDSFAAGKHITEYFDTEQEARKAADTENKICFLLKRVLDGKYDVVEELK